MTKEVCGLCTHLCQPRCRRRRGGCLGPLHAHADAVEQLLGRVHVGSGAAVGGWVKAQTRRQQGKSITGQAYEKVLQHKHCAIVSLRRTMARAFIHWEGVGVWPGGPMDICKVSSLQREREQGASSGNVLVCGCDALSQGPAPPQNLIAVGNASRP